jgi:hypothetical protein
VIAGWRATARIKADTRLSLTRLSVRPGPVKIGRWRFFAWRLFAGRAFACGVLVRVVLVGQDLGQCADGMFELGQVLVEGSLQDRMSGVKVAVGQVIARASDLAPWMPG